LSDHESLTSLALLKRLSNYPENTPLVMTRKDVVKLKDLPPEAPVWVLTQTASVNALWEAMSPLLSPFRKEN
jgi:tetraacyldisaccharide-1-P 4'-kinase